MFEVEKGCTFKKGKITKTIMFIRKLYRNFTPKILHSVCNLWQINNTTAFLSVTDIVRLKQTTKCWKIFQKIHYYERIYAGNV